MHVLTIYRIEPHFDVEYQRASADVDALKRDAVVYARRLGYEPEDETASPEELFADVEFWFDNMSEPDDPQLLLRKADV